MATVHNSYDFELSRDRIDIMLKYFDKAFFKFLFGFLAIVAISLIIIIVAGYYSYQPQDYNLEAVSDECPNC